MNLHWFQWICIENTVGTQWRGIENALGTHWECIGNTLGTHRNALGMHWGHIGDTSGTHWEHIVNTLGTHWRRIGDALEKHWGNIKDTLEMHWQCIGDTLGTHWVHIEIDTSPKKRLVFLHQYCQNYSLISTFFHWKLIDPSKIDAFWQQNYLYCTALLLLKFAAIESVNHTKFYPMET